MGSGSKDRYGFRKQKAGMVMSAGNFKKNQGAEFSVP
jgi:hypothetical protein